jgi:hypothetical protein
VYGKCTAEEHVKLPEWATPQLGITSYTDGKTCPTYTHDAHPPHLLDKAIAIITDVDVGDRITLRTYERGKSIAREQAEVLRITPTTMVVRFLNATHRIRIHGTQRSGHHPGTVIDMDSWGIDPEAPIVRKAERTEHPERAPEMLKGIKVGDEVPLIGYPPFDGMRKRVKVIRMRQNGDLVVRMNSKRTARMHRKGPLAGVIDGEVFCLDTTEEAYAGQDANTAG